MTFEQYLVYWEIAGLSIVMRKMPDQDSDEGYPNKIKVKLTEVATAYISFDNVKGVRIPKRMRIYFKIEDPEMVSKTVHAYDTDSIMARLKEFA